MILGKAGSRLYVEVETAFRDLGARIRVLCTEYRVMVAVALTALFLGLAMEFVWLPPRFTGSPSGWHKAAVMLASGYGYNSLETPKGSKLEAFLNHKCQEISPDEAVEGVVLCPPDGFQRTHRYLFYTIAAMWWLFGLSWSAIGFLQAIALSVTAVLLYGVFRLGMNRLFSAAGALLFISTPFVLSQLISDRDFLKAPFILGCILILGCLIKKGVSTRRYFALAAVLGVVAGVGLGFRQDLTLCVAPSVAVLALCPREGAWRSLFHRVVAIGLMLATWYVCAMPILLVMRSDLSQSFHSLSASFGCPVGLYEPGGSMKLLQNFGDVELATTYSVFTARNELKRPTYEFFNPDAEECARRFVLETVKTYPADCIGRAYASAMYILGAYWNHWRIPVAVSAPMQVVGQTQKALSQHWHRYRLLYVVCALVPLALYSLQTAWLALFLVLYFCCTTSLQFQTRHIFHLCFLPLWFMGFTVEKAYLGVRPAASAFIHGQWRDVRSPVRALGRTSLFLAGVLGVLLVPLYTARAYQCWKVGTLIPKYANAELEPITYDVQPMPQTGQVHLRPTNWPAPDFEALDRAFPAPDPGVMSKGLLRTQYLVIECDVDAQGIGLFPRNTQGDRDWLGNQWRIRVPDAKQPVRVKFFAPIYERSPIAGIPETILFTGLIVSENDVPAIKGIYRVKNIDPFRLLPYVTLPADMSYFHRYDRLPNIFDTQDESR